MELLTDSPNVLSWVLVGLVAAAAVAAVCVVVCAVAVVVTRLRSFEHAAPGAVATPAADRPAQLPVGAEAALNAIVELRPDPRNVVVTHRDPTGEVRLWPAGDAGHLQRTA